MLFFCDERATGEKFSSDVPEAVPKMFIDITCQRLPLVSQKLYWIYEADVAIAKWFSVGYLQSRIFAADGADVAGGKWDPAGSRCQCRRVQYYLRGMKVSIDTAVRRQSLASLKLGLSVGVQRRTPGITLYKNFENKTLRACILVCWSIVTF